MTTDANQDTAVEPCDPLDKTTVYKLGDTEVRLNVQLGKVLVKESWQRGTTLVQQLKVEKKLAKDGSVLDTYFGTCVSHNY